MKICAIIPSYNHYAAMGTILERLCDGGLPIFIIDDGSAEPARSVLDRLRSEQKQIFVHRLPQNAGKGAAVMEGLRRAASAGYTHALQIDADGQHDLGVLPKMLELARQFPGAVICGTPVYDASVPKARLIGRWVTHIWVWVETLSFRIADSMCGFRCYPIAPVMRILSRDKVGPRMEFDTEILVRLFWDGVPPVSMPVNVRYPAENNSNFDLWRDNCRISAMHARLCLTLLARLPAILANRPPRLEQTTHWSDMKERGLALGLQFCALIYRLVGRRGSAILLLPIVGYFFITGRRQRQASRDFLRRVFRRPPTLRDMFRQHMNFALASLDLLGAWTGKITAADIDEENPAILSGMIAGKGGALIIVSHLGSAELSRAALDPAIRDRLAILAHSLNAGNFNAVLRRFAPQAAVNILQVTEIGPETIIDLKQRVEKGEWVVIAGDRVSVLSRERSVRVPFLGDEAAFPQGPWIMAALLECPVYLLFCVRDGARFLLTVEHLADKVDLPRSQRESAIEPYAARYAAQLECHSMRSPLQWYNFFDFWAR